VLSEAQLKLEVSFFLINSKVMVTVWIGCREHVVPTSSLLLLWQANPPGKVRSEAANFVVSIPCRLHIFQISKALSPSSAVMPSCHWLPVLLAEFFLNMRVFIEAQPQQKEQETM